MENGKPNERILDKIRKLMAKAESSASLGLAAEAEAFAAKVQELLVLNKLSMTDIETENYQNEKIKTHQHRGFENSGHRMRRMLWVEVLAESVAVNNDCMILVSPDRWLRIWFVGRESDRQVVDYLFTALVKAINKEVRRQYMKLYNEAKNSGYGVEHLRGFQTSFREGAVAAINKRLVAEKAARDQRYSGDGQYALVVIEPLREVAAWVDQNSKPSGQKANRSKRYNDLGIERGYDFGNKVNFTKGIESGTTTGRLK